MARPRVIYYKSGVSHTDLGLNVLVVLQELTQGSGMDLVVMETQPAAAEIAEYQVAVLFSPDEPLLASIQSIPGTALVIIDAAIAIEGDQAWMIGNVEAAYEQAAFLAGYVAALLTPDWRVGALGLAPTGREANLLEAFVQGGQYFCGLCRPVFPPYYVYPTSISISSEAAEAIGSGLDQAASMALSVLLIDEAVSAYLELTSIPTSFKYLGLQPPQESLRGAWIATLRPAPEQALSEKWAEIISGSPGQSINIPILIEAEDPELLTPGKLLQVEEIRDDLVAGYIQPIGIVE